MPWQTGDVPSDGYRYYYHGYHQKIEFEPCHHIFENDYDADGRYNSDDFAYNLIQGVIDKQKVNLLKHRRNLNQGIQCPYCDEKTTGVSMWVDNKHSEMPESKFKAFRIMGWV